MVENSRTYEKMYDAFFNNDEDQAVQNWYNIFEEVIMDLIKKQIPLCEKYYVRAAPSPGLYRTDHETGSILKYALIPVPGIILEKNYYYSRAYEKFGTMWETKIKEMSVGELIYGCKWMFQPVSIKNLSSPEKQIYKYKMAVEKTRYKKPAGDDQNNTNNKMLVRFIAIIETKLDGSILNQKILAGDKDDKFPHKFAFPKQILAKINRYFVDNYWDIFWDKTPCAAWHCTEKGVAHYLGSTWLFEPSENSDDSQNSLSQKCLELINGPNGDAASILLAYTCFSMLKSFFPSYHPLSKNSPYLEAKKYIPKQIAINVRSDNLIDSEKLTDTCCGYFLNFLSKTSLLDDGIFVQKFPRQLTNLNIGEFEAKLLQSACVLWVNRRPSPELVQSGKILDICLQPQSMDDDSEKNQLSKDLVNALAKKMYEMTQKLSTGSINTGLLIIDNKIKRTKCKGGSKQYSLSLELEYKRRMAILSRLSKTLFSRYVVIGRYDSSRLPTEEIAGSDLSIDIVEKIVYLSVSFRVFAEVITKSNAEYNELCSKVETAVINAFKRQIGFYDPKDILEQYILRILKAGKCARLRGKASDSGNTCLWYAPKQETILISSNDYYNDLKRMFPVVDINKGSFEASLVKDKILSVDERKNQIRRTFETVVQKGGNRRSVLRINVAALSKQFQTNAQRYLDQMKKDISPYRSVKS